MSLNIQQQRSYLCNSTMCNVSHLQKISAVLCSIGKIEPSWKYPLPINEVVSRHTVHTIEVIIGFRI